MVHWKIIKETDFVRFKKYKFNVSMTIVIVTAGLK